MKLVTHKGFTLLELMVVISLTGILSVALYSVFKESSKSVNSINNRIDGDEALLLLYNQLDKDISAACIPALALQEIAKKEKPEDKEKEKEKDKETSPTIKKVFFGKTSNNVLSMLTCITTHSLSNYNAVKPKMTRVIYKLIPEDISSAEKPSYKLLRQELYDLTVKEFGEVKKSYELINRLKDLKVFFISLKEDRKTKKEEPQKADQKKEFTTEKNWSSDDLSEKNYTFLPGYVRFEGERWDKKYQKTVPFIFEYKIISNKYYVPDEKQDKNQDKNKKTAAQDQELLSAKIQEFMNKKEKKQ